MARALNKLSAITVKNLKYVNGETNKHFDGGNLFLLINKDSSKYWRMDYRRPISHKRNTLSFGTYPDVTLEQARIKRDEARKMLKSGIDPAEVRNNSESEARKYFREILNRMVKNS